MMSMLLRPTVMLCLSKRTSFQGGRRAGASAKRSPLTGASSASAATSATGNNHRRAEGEARKSNESHTTSSTAKNRQQAPQVQDIKSAAKSMAENSAVHLPIVKSAAFVPDHREKVLQIFQRLAEINQALGEKYKAQSYQVAVDKLKKDDYIFLHIPPNILSTGIDDRKRQELISTVNATPTVGDKLKTKIVEILSTGDLAELHSLQAKPVIRAIQELTQVHGFGPRTAVSFYKKYGIKSVAELQQRIKEQESGDGGSGAHNKKKKGSEASSIVHLTEAQRLGLKYHRDIMQRISHDEGRLHEAFLKLRLRKYLGKGYELSVCGSYRRRLPTSGDIDVLITRKTSIASSSTSRKSKSGRGQNGDEKILAPQEVLAAFVDALKEERYIEATLAQGPTKFMGVSRLKSYNYNASGSSPKLYPARRLDIRFVEPECFPAALLYFTGSKNFNVVMRAEAIKQKYVLNEYGLFRNDSDHDDGKGRRGRWNAEAFQKLVRAQYYSARSPAFTVAHDEAEAEGEDGDEDEAKRKKPRKPSAKDASRQQQELAALWEEVEARRVKVRQEREIFAALGMPYVQPENREM